MRERSLLHEDPKERARRVGWITEDAKKKGDDDPWIPPARREYLVRAGDEGGWKEEEPAEEFKKRSEESRLAHEERRRTDKRNTLIAERNRWDESTRPDREKFYAIEKKFEAAQRGLRDSIHSIQIGELHDVEERLELYQGHLETWKSKLERRSWLARVFQSRDAKSEVRFAGAQIKEQEKRRQGLLDQVATLEARIRNNEEKMADLKKEHDRQIATKFGSSP